MTIQVMATRFCLAWQVLFITFHFPGVLEGLPQLEENPKKMSLNVATFLSHIFVFPILLALCWLSGIFSCIVFSLSLEE